MNNKSYFDLFAGIGLVDYALDSNDWTLDLAVDYDVKKLNIYKNQFPYNADNYQLRDVYTLKPTELPNSFLGHASFPCTDVSDAGKRAGVGDGLQSSAIDSVLGLLYGKEYHERPSILLTENVKGLLTSNKGDDIRYLLTHFNKLGYRNDLILVDAKYFVPQSRQRIFIISMKEEIVPQSLIQNNIKIGWTRPKVIIKVIEKNKDLQWLHLIDKPEPKIQNCLENIIDTTDKEFWEEDRRDYLISQMSSNHLRLVNDHLNDNKFNYFTAFRRMRVREGKKQSTAEIRTDGLAGCLRTAKGGSAKQILVRVGKGSVDIRLLNELECARLMGAPNFNISDEISKNDYLFGFGDGVCVSAIDWIDNNYLTPIYDNGLKSELKKSRTSKEYTMSLSHQTKSDITKEYISWRKEHIDSTSQLPIKGRLYGALVVLHNLRNSTENDDWSYSNTLKITNTDKSTHFSHRSIQGHTIHKLNLALSMLGREDLKPTAGGEAGRTSTGTKFAGLGIIEIVNLFTSKARPGEIEKIGNEVVDVIFQLVIDDLDKHSELGGIELAYNQNETIGAFVTKLINSKVSKPGAVCQHLVGAKLEFKFKYDSNILISHHSSSTADVQTDRFGDFDLGNAVIHVTKSPTLAHFQKAYENAKAGRTVYILVPETKLGATVLANDIDENYQSKVNVYSIEQFISQNIDEIGYFRKDLSLKGLEEVLKIYNTLIENYENDNSLKIVIPDFGV